VVPWSQLEYLNVSTSSNLCRDNCFHGDLSTMTNLQVLDISHIGFSKTTEFAKIAQLKGLKELYLNNNPLTTVPANLFESLSSLTKLRIAETDIAQALPDSLYARAGFDCDVPQGSSPDGRYTPKPSTATPTMPFPTESPTTASPSANPPTKSPTNENEKGSPTRKPVIQPTKAPSAGSAVSPSFVSSVIVVLAAMVSAAWM
jgi:hypothetical protein